MLRVMRIVVFFFGVLAISSLAQDSHREIARQSDDRVRREVLKSLTSISVMVRSLEDGDETSAANLRLREAIELRLRSNSVVVREGFPRFEVMVFSPLPMTKDGFRTGILRARLMEPVVLERNGVKIIAETWSDFGTLVAGIGDADERLRFEVTRLVDRFCNDYLAANPKQP